MWKPWDWFSKQSKLLEIIKSSSFRNEDLIYGTNNRIGDLEKSLDPLIEVAGRFIAMEQAKLKSVQRILWIAVNPKTGKLEHKFMTHEEIAKILGTQYQVALEGLRDAFYGEPIYIDGAFFVKINTGGATPANVKYYTLNGGLDE